MRGRGEGDSDALEGVKEVRDGEVEELFILKVLGAFAEIGVT